MAVYDLKQGNDSPHKLYSISDSADEELHGIISMKDGKYLACPSSENSVLVFKREDVSHFIDRIQGQPGSVEAIVMPYLYRLKLTKTLLLLDARMDMFVE